VLADGLFCRDVGEGPPILVLHGGPDFDHAYLLPELDRLADSFRLLYYDQRGRGRSARRPACGLWGPGPDTVGGGVP
jgi:proline iminopeptidase